MGSISVEGIIIVLLQSTSDELIYWMLTTRKAWEAPFIGNTHVLLHDTINEDEPYPRKILLQNKLSYNHAKLRYRKVQGSPWACRPGVHPTHSICDKWVVHITPGRNKRSLNLTSKLEIFWEAYRRPIMKRYFDVTHFSDHFSWKSLNVSQVFISG